MSGGREEAADVDEGWGWLMGWDVLDWDGKGQGQARERPEDGGVRVGKERKKKMSKAVDRWW